MDQRALDQSTATQDEVDSRLLARALEMGAGIVMITDELGRIQYVNRAFEEETGYTLKEVKGRKPSMLKSGLQSPGFYQKLWRTLNAGDQFTDVLINRKKDGTIYYEQKTITPLFIDEAGQAQKFISIGRDITDQIVEQRRLTRFVSYDPVTELPNRHLFSERLSQAIVRQKRDAGSLAMVFLNLHRFRRINETLGYEAGDRVLKDVAQRLNSILGEVATLARLSGDNFAFFVEGDQSACLEGLMKSVIDAFRLPIYCCSEKIFLNVSMGVSLYPECNTADVLIKNAETAMVKSKSTGVDQYRFYTSDLNMHNKYKLSMEAELRRAIEKQEFELHYQPQIDLATKELVGVEALIRWNHPKRGMIPPNDFIPLLEETSLILQAGEWVFHQACRDCIDIRSQGFPCNRVAVNLSALQFYNEQLPRVIESVLAEMKLEACALELEITESVVMTGIQRALDTLRGLADLGVRLAVDDFGTGYSSLAYLKQFPVHVLKLASPFVQGVPSDTRDVGISRAIIALAHNLDLEVVAEGVESEEQVNFLAEEQCDIVQGYYFSRPLPKNQLIAFIDRWCK